MAYNWGRWEKIVSDLPWHEKREPPPENGLVRELCESLAADMRKLVHGMGATKVPVAP